ncbi:peptide deformylase [Kordiimonas sp. SCSIO 12610]|uniref:peptide deformylase n=1 Tax=Kordiimonas sp. SCSIO 12610 TaxID=2829597 RepID=UPI00210BD7E0|nr:peptide deformylase [Kordiimonas sp. SCSIO 12610]UTW53911.1 peptide deformylase [Kordiimonas sp. SCSIO 12610]
MPALPLVYAPDPIFKRSALVVPFIDAETQQIANDMLETLYAERGVGMAATMVGILKRIIVIDLQEDGKRTPIVCVNPEILATSKEIQVNNEASLCFPGVSAEITRPETVELRYMDLESKVHTLEATGWLAAIIQHEMEYLDGKTYLDNLSRMKRDRLIKKMIKGQKQGGSCCSDPTCSNNS